MGVEPELGYFRLSELQSIRGRLGLPVERDRFFKPTPLRELLEMHERGRYYLTSVCLCVHSIVLCPDSSSVLVDVSVVYSHPRILPTSASTTPTSATPWTGLEPTMVASKVFGKDGTPEASYHVPA